jgi:hypothetical protein
VVILVQCLPVIGRQADVEGVRVVTGRGQKRENIAGLHIEHDAGRAFRLQQLIGVALQLAIDGQVDFLPGLAGRAFELADHAAIGVDLDAR